MAPGGNNNPKQTPIPRVPRTMKIVNPDGTVTRSGQLLLEQVQAPSATQGTHADRPDPASVPDGALYVESNRSGVIYYNLGGEWHYAAGTMWGTISPDQRPTDLGTNDAGFEFRSIDTNPLLGGHDWMWSGGEWIEVTPIRYGGHGTRLSQPLPDTWNGMIWVETDRSEVIYQNQSGTWHFLAGTMWGTISPDNRPTDLGANDAGFTYRGTDQARSFVWSGTAWVETTGVGGSTNLTHPNVVTKVSSVAGQIVEGGILDQSAANSNSIVITSTGHVGIGVSPAGGANFQVKGGANIDLAISGPVTVAGAVSIQAVNDPITANVPLEIRASMTTVSAGNFGIGTSPTGYLLQLGSDSAGKPGTNTWLVSSDSRLKRNIEPFTDGLETVLRLRPVRYEYNGEAGTPEGMHGVGVIAQEARAVYPAFIHTAPGKIAGEDTEVLSTNTGDLTWMMVNALRELDERLKSLEGTVAMKP